MRIRRLLSVSALAFYGWLFAASAAATPVIIDGTDNPCCSLVGDLAIGYDFVSQTDQWLTALGFWDEAGDGLPLAFPVGVWNTTTQALLGSATIDSADPLDLTLTVAGGQWRYETLLTPVLLASGQTYTLAFQVPNNIGLSKADVLLLGFPTIASAPTATVVDGWRLLWGVTLGFPTTLVSPSGELALSANANAQLTPLAPAAVPEPTTMLLLGTGIAAAAVRRRRNRS